MTTDNTDPDNSIPILQYKIRLLTDKIEYIESDIISKEIEIMLLEEKKEVFIQEMATLNKLLSTAAKKLNTTKAVGNVVYLYNTGE